MCVFVCGFKSDGLPVWRSSGGARAVFRRRRFRRGILWFRCLCACLHCLAYVRYSGITQSQHIPPHTRNACFTHPPKVSEYRELALCVYKQICVL